jgi:hypothetical protein
LLADHSSHSGIARAAVIRLLLQLDPYGRVIARVFAAPHIAIDPGGEETASKGWAQQQMINA